MKAGASNHITLKHPHYLYGETEKYNNTSHMLSTYIHVPIISPNKNSRLHNINNIRHILKPKPSIIKTKHMVIRMMTSVTRTTLTV